MSDAINLHYTKADLDRNFDQRGWVDNAEEVITRYPQRSLATRAKLAHQADVRYGIADDAVLDLFLASRVPAPIQIFVHGGAWRGFTKADYSFPADAYVPAGVHTVVLNFSKLPQVRLPEVIAQVRRATRYFGVTLS